MFSIRGNFSPRQTVLYSVRQTSRPTDGEGVMRWLPIAALVCLGGSVGCGQSEDAALPEAPKAGNANHFSADATEGDAAPAAEEGAGTTAEPTSAPAEVAASPPETMATPVSDGAFRRPADLEAGEALARIDADRATADEPPAELPMRVIPPGAPPRRPAPRTGLLTAGSLNDHANFDDYRDYLSESLQNATGELLPDFSIGQRVEIFVRDAAGNGIPDARVTIQVDGIDGPLLETATRADGRTFLATGLDASETEASQFMLSIQGPNGATATQAVTLDQTPWEVTLPDADAKLPTRLDLALVIDTTGSMGDELEYLKAEIDGIAAAVRRRFPNVEQRFALVVYRDDHDAYVVQSRDFMTSVAQFQEELARHSAGGGGDYPEAMHVALETAGQLEWRDDAAARVMFLVADAPPHTRHIGRTFEALKKLRSAGVAVYPLAGSGTRDQCEFLLRATAFMTGGQYLFLTDHSGVGNPHAKPHAPKYEVEPLDQLMVRLIASELAGRPVPASEIIATEENDGSAPPPPPEFNQQSRHVHPDNGPMPDRFQRMPVEPAAHESHASARVFWASTWFRCTLAAVLIGAIFSFDRWLRR
jgi:Mg-chelatase subunit ChlD